MIAENEGETIVGIGEGMTAGIERIAEKDLEGEETTVENEREETAEKDTKSDHVHRLQTTATEEEIPETVGPDRLHQMTHPQESAEDHNK